MGRIFLKTQNLRKRIRVRKAPTLKKCLPCGFTNTVFNTKIINIKSYRKFVQTPRQEYLNKLEAEVFESKIELRIKKIRQSLATDPKTLLIARILSGFILVIAYSSMAALLGLWIYSIHQYNKLYLSIDPIFNYVYRIGNQYWFVGLFTHEK